MSENKNENNTYLSIFKNLVENGKDFVNKRLSIPKSPSGKENENGGETINFKNIKSINNSENNPEIKITKTTEEKSQSFRFKLTSNMEIDEKSNSFRERKKSMFRLSRNKDGENGEDTNKKNIVLNEGSWFKNPTVMKMSRKFFMIETKQSPVAIAKDNGFILSFDLNFSEEIDQKDKDYIKLKKKNFEDFFSMGHVMKRIEYGYEIFFMSELPKEGDLVDKYESNPAKKRYVFTEKSGEDPKLYEEIEGKFSLLKIEKPKRCTVFLEEYEENYKNKKCLPSDRDLKQIIASNEGQNLIESTFKDGFNYFVFELKGEHVNFINNDNDLFSICERDEDLPKLFKTTDEGINVTIYTADDKNGSHTMQEGMICHETDYENYKEKYSVKEFKIDFN